MQITSWKYLPLRFSSKHLALLIMLPLVFAFGSFAQLTPIDAAELRWRTDVESGLREAKSTHKYVLADVYTDWCHWCKKLDQDTFSNALMIQFLNDKFVCIKANAEDNAEGQRLAGEYGVRGFPCALVFDQSGNFIGKVPGFRDAAAYEQALSQLIAHPDPNSAQ